MAKYYPGAGECRDCFFYFQSSDSTPIGTFGRPILEFAVEGWETILIYESSLGRAEQVGGDSDRFLETECKKLLT